MVQVKANEAVTSLLGPLKERARILDAGGTLIGYFDPVPADEDDQYLRAASLFDAEEVRRSLMALGPGATTEEILERFRATGDS